MTQALPVFDPAALRALAEASAAVAADCACLRPPARAWIDLPPQRSGQLEPLGQISAAPARASWQERHADAQGYWSERAPIAAHWYPYNRCELARCRDCGRAFLRYDESGGHAPQARLRLLDPDLLDFTPAPPA
jgi:hypothetical protein